ncbi:MAG TPA: hypothetical protein VN223_04695 [Candidatus Elarobacter sp.]|nr:hypothetical protein [Candidatus Elarobacter sp.]
MACPKQRWPASSSQVFATKGITGPGLGFWVTLGIIQKPEGRMKVRSSENTSHHGTVFSLFIPHQEQ